ncbi:MAG: phage holin family protein [Clostridiales bacterium]|nr:phage holin family protein [Clostridiales bacterium]
MVNDFLIRFLGALMGNIFVRLLLIAVCADMVFGSLRAAKYRKWNSAVGIDGAIRKAGMLACVLLFTAMDMMMHVDVLGWLPVDIRNTLDACGIVKCGITELFALLFILYEATSVLKNMLLCGLPVPAGLREKLGAWLSTMTEETSVDIVAEKSVTAPIEDGVTADAVRRT